MQVPSELESPPTHTPTPLHTTLCRWTGHALELASKEGRLSQGLPTLEEEAVIISGPFLPF
jgi:hypothetical protein